MFPSVIPKLNASRQSTGRNEGYTKIAKLILHALKKVNGVATSRRGEGFAPCVDTARLVGSDGKKFSRGRKTKPTHNFSDVALHFSVRSRSFEDVPSRPDYVCSFPKSGRPETGRRCRLWATFGLMHLSKLNLCLAGCAMCRACPISATRPVTPSPLEGLAYRIPLQTCCKIVREGRRLLGSNPDYAKVLRAEWRF